MPLVTKLFVVGEEGTRRHGDRWKNTNSRVTLVLARTMALFSGRSLASRMCIGQGCSAGLRLRMTPQFESDMNGFSHPRAVPSQEKSQLPGEISSAQNFSSSLLQTLWLDARWERTKPFLALPAPLVLNRHPHGLHSTASAVGAPRFHTEIKLADEHFSLFDFSASLLDNYILPFFKALVIRLVP